jgi:hypothetical protein
MDDTNDFRRAHWVEKSGLKKTNNFFSSFLVGHKKKLTASIRVEGPTFII